MGLGERGREGGEGGGDEERGRKEMGGAMKEKVREEREGGESEGRERGRRK